MSGDVLSIVEADPTEPEAAALIAELDRFLEERYPDLTIHGIDADGFRQAGGVFLLGRVGSQAVACGAIRPLIPGVAELERMLVRPEYRGRGFARAMLAALERTAAQRGYRAMRLETGANQPEAIALYLSAGYHAIPSFNESISDPRSRCFEKLLDDPM